MATLCFRYEEKTIFVKSNYVSPARPWDNQIKQKHHVSVVCDGNQADFMYYCNDVKIDSDELKNALYCFLSDGIAYNNSDGLKDFMEEFGYEDEVKGGSIYNACKRAWDKWQPFGINSYDLANWMQEKFEL